MMEQTLDYGDFFQKAEEKVKKEKTFPLAEKPTLKRSNAAIVFDFGNGEKKRFKFEDYLKHYAEKESEESEHTTEEEKKEVESSSSSEEEEREYKYRDKNTLTAEDQLNCSYQYGISKSGKFYRVLRDPHEVIIQGSYMELTKAQFESLTEVVEGTKGGRRWVARRGVMGKRAFVTGSLVYLDEEKK